ncbi:MauE/DoxX family redox-associated membrane protein [Sphaerimonospora mesophila]|uniref:MauE/DoxX family redox-associated membrane protein n=1 Tax=Sphaerimonospora mesophila TaxID=37483 RepID=UPI0006E42EFD
MNLFLSWGLRTFLIVIFLTAAVSKVRNRRAFREFVFTVRRLGSWFPAQQTAIMVVASEFAVVVMLAYEISAPWGMLFASVLLTIFLVVILTALATGKGGSCRCFGSSAGELGWPQVVRNLLLILAGIAGFFVQSNATDTDPAAIAASVLAGLGAGGLVVFQENLRVFVNNNEKRSP